MEAILRQQQRQRPQLRLRLVHQRGEDDRRVALKLGLRLLDDGRLVANQRRRSLYLTGDPRLVDGLLRATAWTTQSWWRLDLRTAMPGAPTSRYVSIPMLTAQAEAERYPCVVRSTAPRLHPRQRRPAAAWADLLDRRDFPFPLVVTQGIHLAIHIVGEEICLELGTSLPR